MIARQALLQAISMTTGASHYVVQFECDECVSVPCKLILNPPVPSVGDECCVEWSGEEYTAKVLVMGDEQQARNAECEYLKALDHTSESEHQPPAKKWRLLKNEKPTASKPKNKSAQKKTKSVATKAKKGKNTDFVLDLGSPAKNQGSEKDLHVSQSKKHQAGEAQTSEEQDGEAQTNEEQGGQAQTSEEQAGEAQTSEKQAGDAQTREEQGGEAQTSEEQSGQAQMSEKQAGEAQTSEEQDGQAQIREEQGGQAQTNKEQGCQAQTTKVQARQPQRREQPKLDGNSLPPNLFPGTHYQ